MIDVKPPPRGTRSFAAGKKVSSSASGRFFSTSERSNVTAYMLRGGTTANPTTIVRFFHTRKEGSRRNNNNNNNVEETLLLGEGILFPKDDCLDEAIMAEPNLFVPNAQICIDGTTIIYGHLFRDGSDDDGVRLEACDQENYSWFHASAHF